MIATVTTKTSTEYKNIKRLTTRQVKTTIKTTEKVYQDAKKDAEATNKLHKHLVMIVLGIAITVGLTFITNSIAAHFGPVAAGVPVFWQEIIDWIHRW